MHGMTVLSGVEFFEQARTHAAYQARRDSGRAPNELIEQQAFDQMLGDVRGLEILDLGCGDGQYGRLLLERGCRSYLGIDASSRMIALAQQNLKTKHARLECVPIDQFVFPEAAFDVVVSRMTLHWLEDPKTTVLQIARALRPTGRLVFSVEHPVLTSSDAARVEGEGRTHWVVDDYFIPGPRSVRWFGADVRKYHRTVEDYFQLLRNSGLSVEDLREGTPSAEHIEDPLELRRRQRVPLSLLLGARKSAANPELRCQRSEA